MDRQTDRPSHHRLHSPIGGEVMCYQPLTLCHITKLKCRFTTKRTKLETVSKEHKIYINQSLQLQIKLSNGNWSNSLTE